MKSATDNGEKSGDQSHVRLLSPLLENRRLGWAMLGGGLIYFCLSLVGLKIISCPVRELTGYQCPGCGLTTGSKAMIKGDWASAMHHHWFTPVFMTFWATVGFGLILPYPARKKFIALVKTSERITRWPLVLGVLLVIYSLTRNFLT